MDKHIKRLKEKNEKVFQEIVEMYWVRIFKFSCIYTMSEDVAKEITQDTFLKLWDKKEELAEDTCIITYLMVICRNKCLDYLRKRQPELVPMDEVSEEMIYARHHLEILENSTSDLLIAKELHEIISNAIGQLPEKTRLVFEKSRYEGKMNKEIAEELDLSVKTVEFHITKALQQLRKEIPAEYYIMLFLFFSAGS